MTSPLIERVARALSIADGNHPEACSNDDDETPMWTLYAADARAAIEAMREPSEEMVDAGVGYIWIGWGNDAGRKGIAIEAWQKMIDAALKGEG